MTDTNPLLAPFDTDFGLPPFGQIKTEHFLPALQQRLADHRARVDDLIADPNPPTFGNTVAALEQANTRQAETHNIFRFFELTADTPEMQAVGTAYAPLLTSHEAGIYGDPALFARLKPIHDNRDTLPPQARRLVEKYHRKFIAAGVHLPAAERAAVTDANIRLSTLRDTYKKTLGGDTRASFVAFHSEDELTGLAAADIAVLDKIAADQKIEAPYAVNMSIAEIRMMLTKADRRDVRERVWETFYNRGNNGNEFDTNELVVEIAKTRREIAQGLGYASYADLRLDGLMARTPAAVHDLANQLWEPAQAALQREMAAMTEIAQADGMNEPIQPWDMLYYNEKVRQRDYNVSDAEVRGYLTLENAIAATFHTANRLFGLNFTPVDKAELYHPDARLWEVTGRDGKHVGLLIGDYFARKHKRLGAWSAELRDNNPAATHPSCIISTACNFAKAPDGQPTLLNTRELTTLFHETGHALHALMGKADYPSLAGYNVAWDFVEFPSRLFENFTLCDEVADKFYRHHETGTPMPAALRQKLRDAGNISNGRETASIVTGVVTDMEWYGTGDIGSVAAVEARVHDRLGPLALFSGASRSPQFMHIFQHEAYPATYYSYPWADVIADDAHAAFIEAGDPFDPATAAKLETIFAAGDTAEPDQLFRDFRGRNFTIEPLMEKRGFVTGSNRPGAKIQPKGHKPH